MSSVSTEKTRRMAGLSILTALVIVLQIVATFVKIGAFPVTLTLVPIVIGGALYGRKAGAWLGGVFGFVVMLMCITGGDGGGAILWNANPVLCGALCMVKGIAAGWAAACMYKAVSSKSDTGAVVSAAIISPVVNTGIFIIGVLAFFQPTLLDWAGVAGMDVVNYILFGLAGVNFIIEMVLNIVLSSVIERIINYRVKALA